MEKSAKGIKKIVKALPPAMGSLAEQLKNSAVFLNEFAHAPRQVGSLFPSSRCLTAELVRSVPGGGPGLVVDLGAGTGVVTASLLRAGYPASKIVAVECSSSMARRLRALFPKVLVLEEDACRFNSLLEEMNPAYDLRAVVSSLPFHAMPKSRSLPVLREINTALAGHGGCLVQYTYAFWLRYTLRRYALTPCSRRIVARNLPPAVVEVYTASGKA